MKNLDDVLSGLPADRRQRIELRVKEILAEETASFAKPLAAAVLLKKAVNDSADECGPDCDDYAHGESCPACDPAKWLVDQQVEIERLRSRLTETEQERDVLQDSLAGSLGTTDKLAARLAEAEDLEKDAMESFALIESAPARGFDVYYAVGMARGFIRRHSLLNASLSKGFSKGFSKDAPADRARLAAAEALLREARKQLGWYWAQCLYDGYSPLEDRLSVNMKDIDAFLAADSATGHESGQIGPMPAGSALPARASVLNVPGSPLNVYGSADQQGVSNERVDRRKKVMQLDLDR